MNLEEQKKAVIERLIREGYIKSKRVIDALLKVPREEFVPEHLKEYAYVDKPLEIGYGQTISAIHMVGMMSELLDLKPGMKVLEIGTGCGYHAAVTAEIVGEDGLVVSIERIPELAEKAERTLRKLGYDNVIVIVGDGTLGYEPLAPYDRIYTTAAGPKIPEPLIKQLKDGGKLLMPIGRYLQKLVLAEKRGNEIIVKDCGPVAFVPLIGREGFYG
ncbi:protein-L-isoaspartate O-methyltransferase [Methanocaldococcus sp. FS406-22]|uniref:protein-L-isoaspartate O-methyltransferase n=1 Tax=Methanocaldococcus sp. (strain FS406-22) TaxID=644281 RepID=UPI0001BF1DCD|nr:protein-L-isoaspartate O-methyltransferase [Methanocaldococcus sp. FS406-22]ADC68800.1 protein-L-isoaspartate O-methyltransferase [Methanocaldococcus sp. FS406-22]